MYGPINYICDVTKDNIHNVPKTKISTSPDICVDRKTSMGTSIPIMSLAATLQRKIGKNPNKKIPIDRIHFFLSELKKNVDFLFMEKVLFWKKKEYINIFIDIYIHKDGDRFDVFFYDISVSTCIFTCGKLRGHFP